MFEPPPPDDSEAFRSEANAYVRFFGPPLLFLVVLSMISIGAFLLFSKGSTP